MSRQMEPFALMLRDVPAGSVITSISLACVEGQASSLGVVDLGREGNFGRLERVIGREGDVEEENAARVWRVTLQCRVQTRQRDDGL